MPLCPAPQAADVVSPGSWAGMATTITLFVIKVTAPWTHTLNSVRTGRRVPGQRALWALPCAEQPQDTGVTSCNAQRVHAAYFIPESPNLIPATTHIPVCPYRDAIPRGCRPSSQVLFFCYMLLVRPHTNLIELVAETTCQALEVGGSGGNGVGWV